MLAQTGGLNEPVAIPSLMGTLFGQYRTRVPGASPAVAIPSLMGTLFGLEEYGELERAYDESQYPR